MNILRLTLNALRSTLAAIAFIAFAAYALAGPIEIPSTTISTLTTDVGVLKGKIVAQADTNETTTATAYTPRFVGDTLVGGAGAGTNAVWIANGATTNDWVALKP